MVPVNRPGMDLDDPDQRPGRWTVIGRRSRELVVACALAADPERQAMRLMRAVTVFGSLGVSRRWRSIRGNRSRNWASYCSWRDPARLRVMSRQASVSPSPAVNLTPPDRW
jgi:hypothetical protein